MNSAIRTMLHHPICRSQIIIVVAMLSTLLFIVYKTTPPDLSHPMDSVRTRKRIDLENRVKTLSNSVKNVYVETAALNKEIRELKYLKKAMYEKLSKNV
ncbi:Uncharacterised protein g9 [Pycnogonum litorale]